MLRIPVLNQREPVFFFPNESICNSDLEVSLWKLGILASRPVPLTYMYEITATGETRAWAQHKQTMRWKKWHWFALFLKRLASRVHVLPVSWRADLTTWFHIIVRLKLPGDLLSSLSFCLTVYTYKPHTYFTATTTSPEKNQKFIEKKTHAWTQNILLLNTGLESLTPKVHTPHTSLHFK